MIGAGGRRPVIGHSSTRGCDDNQWHRSQSRLRCSPQNFETPATPPNSDNDNDNDLDANQASSPHSSIESWLAVFLPSIAPADLRRYAAILGNDGVTSIEKLRGSIDTAGSQSYLDFMKRGHRRVLINRLFEKKEQIDNKMKKENPQEGHSSSSSDNNKAAVGLEEDQPQPLRQEEKEDEGGVSLNRLSNDVEALERYLQKRRAERIAEEEDLEQLLSDAKDLKASLGSSDESSSGGEAQTLIDKMGAIAKSSEVEEKGVSPHFPGAKGEVRMRAGEECVLGEEESWQDECWDITREPIFSTRTASSLSTGRRRGNDGFSHSKRRGWTRQGSEHGAGKECVLGEADSWDDECWDYYDITRNSFPEDARAGQEPTRAFAASPRAFRGGDMSEMNDRPPRTAVARLENQPAALGSEKSEMNDPVASAFSATASALFKKIKADHRRDATRKGGEEYTDITQKSFPDLQSSFNDAEKSEMNSRAPPRRVHSLLSSSPRSSSSIAAKKMLTNATPSIKADEEEQSSYLDIASLFPEDRRPSSLVNTIGTKTPPGRRQLGLVRNEITTQRLDASLRETLDVTKKFPWDRPAMSVNTGTKTKVIHGLKNVDSTKPNKSKHRNINEFSSDFAPPSRAVDSSSTKHEKYLDAPSLGVVENVPFKKHTNADPNPFARKKTSSSAAWHKGIKKQAPKQKPPIMEADKYLDTNQFSWNLSPNAAFTASKSSSFGKTPTPSQQQKQQPFLDTPRPFRSSSVVNMRSSNYSGAKFKRSSDIPPEKKKQNRKDCYDISSLATAAAAAPENKKRETGWTRKNGNQSVEKEGAEELKEYFDITRVALPMGSRTSSVIKDANSVSGRVVGSNEGKISPTPSDSGSDYDEVMIWLLTNLPQLQEEDAIAYFNHLLEDGFDSTRMLQDELEEGDLYFMKRGHQKTVLKKMFADRKDDRKKKILTTVGTTKQQDQALTQDGSCDDQTSSFLVSRESSAQQFATKNLTCDKEQTTVRHANGEWEERKDCIKNVKRGEPCGSSNGALKKVTAPTSGAAPRAELYQYYSQKKGFTSAQSQRLKDYFTIWTNGAKSHELEFTCVFTCPITGEHFACGNLDPFRQVVPSGKDHFFWYSKWLKIILLFYMTGQ